MIATIIILAVMLLLSIILEFNLYGQIEKLEDKVWERNNELIRKNDELISSRRELVKRNNQLIASYEENKDLCEERNYLRGLVISNPRLNKIYETTAWVSKEDKENQLKEETK